MTVDDFFSFPPRLRTKAQLNEILRATEREGYVRGLDAAARYCEHEMQDVHEARARATSIRELATSTPICPTCQRASRRTSVGCSDVFHARAGRT